MEVTNLAHFSLLNQIHSPPKSPPQCSKLSHVFIILPSFRSSAQVDESYEVDARVRRLSECFEFCISVILLVKGKIHWKKIHYYLILRRRHLPIRP